ncbi:MAG: leucyl aminopeptidase [Armatimonadota bacterium]
MDIRVIHGSVTDIESDALIINLFEGVTSPGGATGAVDRILDGQISSLIADGEITGKLMEMTLIHTAGRIAPKRVLVAGLGKSGGFNYRAANKVAGASIRFLCDKGVKSVTSIIHGGGIGGLDISDATRSLIEGTMMGLYRADFYKSSTDAKNEIERFTIVEHDQSKLDAIERGINYGRILSEAVNAARTLGNEPSNVMTPTALASHARICASDSCLDYEEFDMEQMRDMGMNGIISVAQGSIQPPRLIILRYKAGDDKQSIAFVGKAVTFDSGGISIKPDTGMRDMKFDMAGGAAVIQAMKAISELKPDINVTGYIPAVENMPSASAYKPGDVIKCYNGKTVEITTTDAEGRMILSDAIAYAVEQGADYIIDVATLTGGCIVALGHDFTGIMGNNQSFIDNLVGITKLTGERVWQLPLPDDYKDIIKSSIADMINAGTRQASAIQGGLFLQEFADDVPWIHMDIAGTSDISSDGGPAGAEKYLDKGATGVGVRTLVMLVMQMGKQ